MGTNYPAVLCDIPEEKLPQLHCCKDLKTQTQKIFLTQSCPLYVVYKTAGWICKTRSLYGGSYEDYHLVDEFGSSWWVDIVCLVCKLQMRL